MKNTKMDALQGLRGVAAILVVIAHGLLALIRHKYPIEELRAFAYACGEFGVTTFFVISGFIMVLTTRDQYGVPGAPLEFLRKRLIRIVPLYWIVTLLTFTVFVKEHDSIHFIRLVESILFIPTANDTGEMHPVASVGWTLNYEMFFYIIFTLSLFFKKALASCVIIGATGALAIIGQCWGATIQELWGEQSTVTFYVSGILKFFCFGAILGFLFTSRRESIQCVPFGWALFLFISFACIALSFSVGSKIGERPEWVVIVAAVGSVLIAAIADDRGPEGLFTHFARESGDASYSIYLTHNLVMGPLAFLWMRLFARGWPIFLGLAVGLTVVIGVAVFRYAETPLLKVLRQRVRPSALALNYKRRRSTY